MLGWPASALQRSNCLCVLCWNHSHTSPCLSFFMGAGDSDSGLSMLVCQMLHQLSHLSSFYLVDLKQGLSLSPGLTKVARLANCLVSGSPLPLPPQSGDHKPAPACSFVVVVVLFDAFASRSRGSIVLRAWTLLVKCGLQRQLCPCRRAPGWALFSIHQT